jgi:hypothetical protein
MKARLHEVILLILDAMEGLFAYSWQRRFQLLGHKYIHGLMSREPFFAPLKPLVSNSRNILK